MSREWLVEDLVGGVHVTPEDDLIVHDRRPDCFCSPRVEVEDSHLCGSPYQFVRRVYVHRAMDDRD